MYAGWNILIHFLSQLNFESIYFDSINDKRIKDSQEPSLFATPHALKIKTQQDLSMSRAWFGRMILPPQDAFVSSSDDHTFGQIRARAINHFSTSSKSLPGIGCSSSEHELGLHGSSISRNLQECAEDELYCWFRCMPLVEHDAHTCTERNLQLQCANPRDQVVPDGMMHGDYYPACTNSTDPVTDYPKIEQQDELTCPDLWEDFLSSEEEYDHTVDLTVPNGPKTHFMWSIVDGMIKGRLVHDNVFGWLAMGFADPDGGHNGMNGGQILLATPYSTEDYSPVTGLDNSSEAMIATYVIDPDDTAFRHWQDPIDTDEALATESSFETNDCSTSISFMSSHINGKDFNIDGTDEMIWAGNSNDYFVGYHGPFSRMRFTIDWKSGTATPFSSSQEEESHVEGSGDNGVTVGVADLVPDTTKETLSTSETGNGAVGNFANIWIVSIVGLVVIGMLS